ncbi:MAG: hypothetical protein AMXMBFR83_06200 [Phycisphaerae bacterium]
MSDELTSPTPLNVLLVVDDDAYDRLGSVVLLLCVGMIDEPVKLRVLLRTRRGAGFETIGPAPVVQVRHRRWNLGRRWAERILDRLEDAPPDVIHAMSVRAGWWARHLAVAGSCRLVVHVTDREDLRDLDRLGGEADAAAVTITPQLHELLTDRRPEWRRRSRLIPFGVPAQAEPACLEDPQRIPSAIVTTPLTGDCGLCGALRSLQTLIRAGQEVQLFILSTGRAETALRRQVEQLQLQHYVTFAPSGGDWDTVRGALRGADFFLETNPARRFTAHTLMAMADGLAILAPRGLLADGLIDQTTACLFDPARPRDLAEKWGRLLQDRSAARRLAHSALDYVSAHHQAGRMVAATASLYRELCAVGEFAI